MEGAGGLAAHRLKTNFILGRIAEQEKIQVTREDLEKASGRSVALQHVGRKDAQRT